MRWRVSIEGAACVRSDKFGEEIAACVDMSRGGVSFRSRNRYEQGMQIKIAVPFSKDAKEASAIFVRGRIANVREVEGGEMCRCGVEFVRGS